MNNSESELLSVKKRAPDEDVLSCNSILLAWMVRNKISLSWSSQDFNCAIQLLFYKPLGIFL
uniref:Uncharacterized protein n=1 Tax=Arundo donax TaxID=35708 RepID=A0A0A9EPR0_ARUDO